MDLLDKLTQVHFKFEAIERELEDPATASDNDKLRKLSKERHTLLAVEEAYHKYSRLLRDLEGARELLRDTRDPEMREMAEEELKSLEEQYLKLEDEIKVLLIPPDPNDSRDSIVEIRAGTGGDEAALFAGDLYRMYSRFAERQGWKLELIDENESALGGYKEISFSLGGTDVFAKMKFESGVHRVQRVPQTETQGRVHTSAATVAVLPEAEEVDIEINPNDLRIDIFRSGGKGGQNVNKVLAVLDMNGRTTGNRLIAFNPVGQVDHIRQFVGVGYSLDAEGISRAAIAAYRPVASAVDGQSRAASSSVVLAAGGASLMITSETELTAIVLSDIIGREIKRVIPDEHAPSCIVPVGELASGVYFVTVRTSADHSETHRIVIAH